MEAGVLPVFLAPVMVEAGFNEGGGLGGRGDQKSFKRIFDGHTLLPQMDIGKTAKHEFVEKKHG
jgi:hypothetical protein